MRIPVGTPNSEGRTEGSLARFQVDSREMVHSN